MTSRGCSCGHVVSRTRTQVLWDCGSQGVNGSVVMFWVMAVSVILVISETGNFGSTVNTPALMRDQNRRNRSSCSLTRSFHL